MGGNDQSARKAAERNRLAEELRANLQRRKAQARSRRDGAADERRDEIDVVPADPEGRDGDASQ